jgi:hypothetical protein
VKLTSVLLALFAILAGTVIAGCGDDDDEEPQALGSGATGATGEAGSLDLAGFVDAADGVCKDASDALAEEGLEQYPEGPPTGEDAVAFSEDVVIPNLEQQHEGIAALPVPEGEEEAVDDLLSKLQSGIDELKQDPGSFVTSDALEPASQAAKDLGLKECGQ